jgi:uncharacterized membrane protein
MSSMTTNSAEEDAYQPIGRTLLIGLVVSIAVMAVGLVVAAARGTTTSHVLPLDRVLPQLAKGTPAAILDAGILLLFATPLFGVLVALGAFVRQRDLPFAGITALLLVMLALAFAVALH